MNELQVKLLRLQINSISYNIDFSQHQFYVKSYEFYLQFTYNIIL